MPNSHEAQLKTAATLLALLVASAATTIGCRQQPAAVADEFGIPAPSTSSVVPENTDAVPLRQGAYAEPVPTSPPSNALESKASLKELVRRREWQSVEARLAGAELPSPFERFLWARTAFELGRYETAIERYSLAEADPDLQRFIDGDTTLARVRAGDLSKLPKNWFGSVEPIDIVIAAERLLDQNRYDDARVVIAEAARRLRGSGEGNARLHAARARWAWAKEFRYRAYADWRWLATKAPLHTESQEALLALEAAFPEHPLTAAEREHRTELFSEAGRVDAVLEELEQWKRAKGRKPSEAEAFHFAGWANYKRRNYEAAIPPLLASAERGGRHARNDRYYAAQSLSRLGRQPDAIAHYLHLKKEKGRTAHLAAFRVAREHSFIGDWKRAIEAYSDFITHHPGSEFTETALRERALSRYANGEFSEAAFEFKRLRYLRPRSQLVSSYQQLEGLSLLGTERALEGIAVLERVAREEPFTFSGIIARSRLLELEHSIEPLGIASTATERSPELPQTVRALEDIGLFEHAETLLTRKESELAAGDGFERFEAECGAHARLLAGRRRLLLGLAAARVNALYGDPLAAPRWVWSCLHPTPYRAWVVASAREFDVPSPLTYAIMRQESGFRPSVVSPAEARGLMQVIPTTALEIARSLGERTSEDDAPLAYDDPHQNIRYGTYYLGQLLRALNEHPALAAAGYNAGPAAVGLWLAAGRELPLEVFVARIPFDETRNYVMNVIRNLAAYQLLDPESGAVQIPLTLHR